MVMVMVMRLRGKRPRLEALLPAHVAAVMVATLAHMPPCGSFPFARRLSQPGHWKSINAPEAEFPAPKGPGYLVRYSVERIGGVGPWRPASH
jgi:hypothetical protein